MGNRVDSEKRDEGSTTCSPPTTGTKIVIATYNVNWGFARTKRHRTQSEACRRIVDTLIETSADVVFLQETHKGWEKRIANEQSLQKRYPHRWFSPPRSNFGGSGAGFLSRWPIRRRKILNCPDAVEGSMAPALMCTIVATDENAKETTRFRCLNVHLRPSISNDVPSAKAQQQFMTKAAFVLKSVPAYFSSGAVRLAEMKWYIEKNVQGCKRQLPLLVAGDFNENERGPAVKWLLRSMSRAHLDEVTWRWPVPLLGSTTDRFDHILYDAKSCRCQSCRVVKDTGLSASDHYAVEATLFLKEQRLTRAREDEGSDDESLNGVS